MRCIFASAATDDQDDIDGPDLSQRELDELLDQTPIGPGR